MISHCLIDNWLYGILEHRMNDCIFCKIVAGQFESEFEYEDENVVSFKDIHPQARVHILTIPKKHIKEFADLEDDTILISVRKAMQALIKKYELKQHGYRLEVNGGGAQLVDHLHFHLMGYVPKPSA